VVDPIGASVILAIIFMSYLFLALTIMSIGLGWSMANPELTTQQQREAVLWWAWFWPYMVVRWVFVKAN
jgi:hypothetical protein